jgi:signal transduction histidine kinase
VLNRDAITQSLVNLIDNAIKYSGSSKELIIRLGQEAGYVTVSVTDCGIGIPREEQQRIFDKFYRVSRGLVHDVKGSGLGLSIVKHIVEAHQGKIGLKSQPGVGTTFTMYLPIDGTRGDVQSRRRLEDSVTGFGSSPAVQDGSPRPGLGWVRRFKDSEEL